MEAPFCLYFSSFGQMIRPIIDSMSVRPTAASGTSSVSHSSSASSSSTTGTESIFEPRDTSSANQTAAGRRGQPDGWSVCFKWAYFGTSINYNEGPRDWQNWLTKMNLHYVGVCFLYFTITGVKNIVQQQHFLTNDNPWLFLCFTFFSVAQKGEGWVQKENNTNTPTFVPSTDLPPLWKQRATESTYCFHSYLIFLLAHRPLWSIPKVNGTFYESLSLWSDAFVKVSVVFYTKLCPCLAL